MKFVGEGTWEIVNPSASKKTRNRLINETEGHIKVVDEKGKEKHYLNGVRL